MEYINIELFEKYTTKIIELWVVIWWKILFAIIIAWIWFKIIKLINTNLLKVMEKTNWDPLLESFLVSLVSIILKIVLFIIIAGILGVQTTSFIAMIAAAWFAIGMALSWTLQNFAGWIMILFLKPFKNWDFVEVWGHSGSVRSIGIFNTILITINKQKVIIPNSEISNGSMINYSSEPIRRLDLEVGISYTDSIKLAKETLEKIAKKEKTILQDEEITIWVKSLWDSAIILVFRSFVKTEDYWNTFFRLNEVIKETFDKKWLNFPFPQRDVHLYKEK